MAKTINRTDVALKRSVSIQKSTQHQIPFGAWVLRAMAWIADDYKAWTGRDMFRPDGGIGRAIAQLPKNESLLAKVASPHLNIVVDAKPDARPAGTLKMTENPLDPIRARVHKGASSFTSVALANGLVLHGKVADEFLAVRELARERALKGGNNTPSEFMFSLKGTLSATGERGTKERFEGAGFEHPLLGLHRAREAEKAAAADILKPLRDVAGMPSARAEKARLSTEFPALQALRDVPPMPAARKKAAMEL